MTVGLLSDAAQSLTFIRSVNYKFDVITETLFMEAMKVQTTEEKLCERLSKTLKSITKQVHRCNQKLITETDR
jgi:hypothetical protein